MAWRKIVPVLTLLSMLAGCQYMYMGGAMVKGAGYDGNMAAAVSISGYSFSPSTVSFPGSKNVTVTWTNNDPVAHTVTSDGGASSFTSSPTIGPGGTYSLVFPTTPGTYTYHCSIHPYMTGSITVQ